MTIKSITHHGITFDMKALEIFCKNNGIKKLSLFGSVLRDDFGPNSDIDMLVEFIPGETVGYMRLIGIETALTELFGVRKVDLRTPGEISDLYIEKIMKESEILYVHSVVSAKAHI